MNSEDDTFKRLKRPSLAELTRLWDSSNEYKNFLPCARGSFPFNEYLKSHDWTHEDWEEWVQNERR